MISKRTHAHMLEQEPRIKKCTCPSTGCNYVFNFVAIVNRIIFWETGLWTKYLSFVWSHKNIEPSLCIDTQYIICYRPSVKTQVQLAGQERQQVSIFEGLLQLNWPDVGLKWKKMVSKEVIMELCRLCHKQVFTKQINTSSQSTS